MRKNLFSKGLICFLIMFFISSQSSALMIALSTEKLTRGSETVIRGEVEEVESQWSEDKEIIFTSAMSSKEQDFCLKHFGDSLLKMGYPL